MRIARVFPCKTSCTPDDELSFFDVPGMFMPEFDEVHVCTVFTWDIHKSKLLADAWKSTGKPVKIGGPAYGDSSGDFIPGLYVRGGGNFYQQRLPE